MNSTNFDIIISGAGPAGATAALALQQSGLKVALIDAAVFPRDKVCGDAVSSVVKNVLKKIDQKYVDDLLEFPPKSNITGAVLHSPDFTRVEISFKKVGHCIRRLDFDNWLYQKAVNSANITPIIGNKVIDIGIDEHGVNIRLQNGQDLYAKLHIGCDGAQSVSAKKLANYKVDRNHYSGAVRQYFKNVKGLTGNQLEVYFLKNYLPGYFWIFPLNDNEANVGFGMLSDTISKRKIDLKKSIRSIISEIPEVSARFADSIALEEPIGFGLPLGSKKYPLSGNRFMLCGDAACLIDPFSGEGIETAMYSGLFAAQVSVKAFDSQNFSADLLKQYDKLVYDKMWPTFRNHYYMQKVLSDRIGLINFLAKCGNIPWLNRQLTRFFY